MVGVFGKSVCAVILALGLSAAESFAESPPRCVVKVPSQVEIGQFGRARGRSPVREGPGTGLNIVLQPGPTLLGDAQAMAAWEEAAANLENLFADSVTVVVNADIGPLAPGVLASTGNTYFFIDFDMMRDAMMADAGADEVDLLAGLPNLAELNAFMLDGYTLSDDGFITAANCRAIGLDCDTPADGLIQFTTLLPFDYDPSDGITPGTIDFVGVAMHEMIHLLGFASIVDFVDLNESFGGPPFAVTPTPMDLFRLQPAEGVVDFTSALRLFVPGEWSPEHACFDGAVDLRFSEGLAHGDLSQASHWRDDLLPPFFDYGLMDPNVVPGALRELGTRDLRMLDLLGWDLVSTPADDCNGNILADAQDIATGTSPDCNTTDIPDECEVGDFDTDGDVDIADYAELLGCLEQSPAEACAAFDADCDGGIDLADFGTFQLLYSGAG